MPYRSRPASLFVHIDAYLATMDETYAMLGDLLAMPNEAQGLADYCRAMYDRVKAIADSVDKANILYITGDEGLERHRPGLLPCGGH